MSRTAVDLSRRAAGGAAFATWLAARISEMMMVTEMMPAATAVSATTLDETANLARMYVCGRGRVASGFSIKRLFFMTCGERWWW